MTTTRFFLELESAGQRDVAVEVPFVKLIEQDRAHTVQLGIGEHPAQQHAFGHVADARVGGGDVVEPHLIAHLSAESCVSRPRDPGCEHACRQPARLQDRHLTILQQSAVEQHLRHLR
jgi:hypothetical protein